MARTASRLFPRGLGSRPVGISFTTWLMRPIPTSATSARMIGILDTLNPSAICSGRLAPATSSTTATNRKNFRYRNSPRITAQASTAISVACDTPRVSSTYSWGRLASTAVTVISPISTSSRIRIRVRKSSRSAFSAAMLPPFSRILKAWRGAGKRRIQHPMSKAFVKDEGVPQEVEREAPAIPDGKNYITPEGYARLKAELKQLAEVERPAVVKTVAWAASLGDRSENADYLYGKRRLREIDRRMRFLIKRLEAAQVVSAKGRDTDQVFFGATVRIKMKNEEKEICIVGVDEVDASRGRVSWVSPIARALLKTRAGDSVTLRTPSGDEELEILEGSYRGGARAGEEKR